MEAATVYSLGRCCFVVGPSACQKGFRKAIICMQSFHKLAAVCVQTSTGPWGITVLLVGGHSEESRSM